MDKQITDSNIHLHLGLTRNELKKRLLLGTLDTHLMTRQLTQYSEEIILDALCEQWIETYSMDQAAKDQLISPTIPSNE